MSHLIYDSPYDFYDLPDEEAGKLVGRVYKSRKWKTNKKKDGVVYTKDIAPGEYYVVSLKDGEFNYGKKNGVLYLSPVWSHGDRGDWFKVGVFSPDDLDLDLEFYKDDTCLRSDVIRFMRGMQKRNVTYIGVLESIQRHVGAGIIG